jgi:predicted DNA-binding protein (MmcQ/YjbR family)
MSGPAGTAKSLSTYCLSKSGAEAGYPFGPGALVMKVGGKIFAIIAEDEAPVSVSLKCEPEIARVLRASYEAVKPGYHLNKRHWNTVTLDRDAPVKEVFQWIDDSYDLVVDSLPRRARPGR